ncbi:hypothetical protein [Streptomyces sp. NPDC054756]
MIEHGTYIDGRQHRPLSNWGGPVMEYVEVAMTAEVPGLAIVGLG